MKNAALLLHLLLICFLHLKIIIIIIVIIILERFRTHLVFMGVLSKARNLTYTRVLNFILCVLPMNEPIPGVSVVCSEFNKVSYDSIW